MRLRAGDWVQIRSKAEILATLDKSGCMEKLPFMPQMFNYCGQVYQVHRRAHKTCDWIYTVKARRVSDAVHLNLRCDGESYGGCQTSCLIFWKEAWLMRVDGPTRSPHGDPTFKPINLHERTVGNSKQSNASSICTETDVLAATRSSIRHDGDEPRYVCQATQVMEFTTPLPWWDVRQYFEDYTSGNASLSQLFRALIFSAYRAPLRSGIGLGRPMAWVYDWFQSLWGGVPFPSRVGAIPAGQPTPKPTSNPELRVGHLVRVRPFKEILSTLNTEAENRGLYFDAEMVPYCGGIYRIRIQVLKFVDEKTGQLKTLKTPVYILEGVICEARYARCRMLCPRSIYPWWREIWLERVPESTVALGEPLHTRMPE